MSAPVHQHRFSARFMESEQKQLGVLFADVSDSSHLFNVYDNEGARDILLECIRVMRDVVQAGPGRVVERIGDELLTVFPTADTTVRAAVDLQTAIAKSRRRGSLPSFLSVRIGFHFGDVLTEGGSLFGDTVYTANRVCALAKGNQILTTGDTVARLPEAMRLAARFREKRTLKGKQQVHDIFEVPWDDPLGTAGPPVERSGPGAAVLELTCEKQHISLSSSRPVCTIGRSEQCDIRVALLDVSRTHARIEYQNGYFIVVDSSRNGTTVRSGDGRNAKLRGEELRLNGAGVIRVGQEPPFEIRFVSRVASVSEPDRPASDSSRSPQTD